ncbi:TIR domain-containing protein [Porphyrobacter sp. LM 6]|uniref:TIR domain-containing protein n=1 Tax=Porphyrobacter sp. LM 6 TaxID=1896196 RepID=UPI000846EBD4|nr:TIR domain-containing protein [Porphyrobacter sp. LM 6]AOL93727.1 TolB amino-terminal domain-containing protein [Porphyrobacter sp. LM 6]
MDSSETDPASAGQADARPLIFLSYSRTDLAHAQPVIALLEAQGYAVWWDGRLEGGENYLQTTEATLEGADCVVVLWSATSVESHWVRDEAQRGRERGCLVPLSIDGTFAPLGFRQFQLLDISGWDGKPASPEAERILVAVRARIGGGAERPVPVRPMPTPAQPQPSTPAPALALSRRTLMLGGAGVAVGAGLLGAWQFGMFGSPANAAISMVVLPFANQTGDPEKKYFSDGLARELRTVLARNPRLNVAAPTSSSAIEGEDDFAIGRKLGVGHILRGSVQRDTARVRVTAELIEIEGGLVRWAETYDRALEDVFAVQSEIAQTVAVSLVAQIATEGEAKQAAAAQAEIGGTKSVAAYEAFLRGLAFYDLSAGEDTDRAALAQFDAAVADDPGYAAAHAMRATMLASLANAANAAEEARQLYVQSIAAAERSIAIEPKLARGQAALGFALNNGQFKRAQAAVHYRAAEQLAAGDADILRGVAMFNSYGNASEQAVAKQMIERVIELDPLNARAFLAAGYIALFARDYPLLITRMERALAINPSMTSANFGIANARLMMGDAAGALAAADKEPVQVFSLTAKAIAAGQLGDAAAADAAYAALIDQYGDASLYQQGQILAQRGAPDEALARLQQAYVARDPGLLFAPNDPLLDPLRGEAGFKDLLSRLGS